MRGKPPAQRRLKGPLGAPSDPLEASLVVAAQRLLSDLEAFRAFADQHPNRPGLAQVWEYLSVAGLAMVSATDIAAGREPTYQRRKRENHVD